MKKLCPLPGFELLNAVPPRRFGQQTLAGLPVEQHAWQQQKQFPCSYCFDVADGFRDDGASEGQGVADPTSKELWGLLEKESFLDQDCLEVDCV